MWLVTVLQVREEFGVLGTVSLVELACRLSRLIQMMKQMHRTFIGHDAAAHAAHLLPLGLSVSVGVEAESSKDIITIVRGCGCLRMKVVVPAFRARLDGGVNGANSPAVTTSPSAVRHRGSATRMLDR
jgi:hypothetical protein